MFHTAVRSFQVTNMPYVDFLHELLLTGRAASETLPRYGVIE